MIERKDTFRTISLLHKLIFSLTLLLVVFSCTDESDDFDNLDILAKINSLEGVSAIEIDPNYGYPRAFQIDVTQPVDHDNPDGATFTQRIYLSHSGEDMPMVFAPSGYAARPTSGQEIAGILQTNCMNVTHRYFIDSEPSPLDWSYLTVKQSAADHHRIVTLFKRIYDNVWISSGGSKSGLTCLYHKRFYPDDVDATIAYVAPFVFGPKDMQYEEYLSNIGDPGCYDKLQNLVRLLLQNRTEVLALVDNYISSSDLTWSMDKNLVLELAVMDYPFAFWQYYDYSCSDIPTADNTVQEMFDHFTTVVPISSFSDENKYYYEPYVYQSLTEMGAPGYDPNYISDLLQELDPNDQGNQNFELMAPDGITLNFEYTTQQDVYSWLQTQGENIIFIYGENDPWSAGAIELTGATNAVYMMQPGENHRVKIADLDNPEIVYNALESWLGIDLLFGGTKSTQIEYEEPNPFRLR